MNVGDYPSITADLIGSDFINSTCVWIAFSVFKLEKVKFDVVTENDDFIPDYAVDLVFRLLQALGIHKNVRRMCIWSIVCSMAISGNSAQGTSLESSLYRKFRLHYTAGFHI